MPSVLDHSATLVFSKPTTIAGVAALLRYFMSLEEWQQPRDWVAFEADGEDVGWRETFYDTLATALENISAAG